MIKRQEQHDQHLVLIAIVTTNNTQTDQASRLVFSFLILIQIRYAHRREADIITVNRCALTTSNKQTWVYNKHKQIHGVVDNYDDHRS